MLPASFPSEYLGQHLGQQMNNFLAKSNNIITSFCNKFSFVANTGNWPELLKNDDEHKVHKHHCFLE